MMQQIEHIVFILLLLFVGAGVVVGSYRYFKRKLFYPVGTKKIFNQLSHKQKQLNQAFDKMLDEPKKKKS